MRKDLHKGASAGGEVSPGLAGTRIAPQGVAVTARALGGDGWRARSTRGVSLRGPAAGAVIGEVSPVGQKPIQPHAVVGDPVRPQTEFGPQPQGQRGAAVILSASAREEQRGRPRRGRLQAGPFAIFNQPSPTAAMRPGCIGKPRLPMGPGQGQRRSDPSLMRPTSPREPSPIYKVPFPSSLGNSI